MKESGKAFIKILKLVALAGVFVFSGCNNIDSKEDSQYGTIVWENKTADSGKSADIRAVFTDNISSAFVYVTGSGINEPYPSASAVVTKGAGSATVENIPVGKNRIFTVEAKDSDGSKITDYVLSAVVDIKSGINTIDKIDWSTTKTGNIYKALLAEGKDIGSLDSEQSSSITALVSSLAETHASLINYSSIASDFDSGFKSASSYKLSSGSVEITCYGIDGKSVFVSDPASSVMTVSGSSCVVSIADVLPGTWDVYVKDADVFTKKGSVTVTGGAAAEFTIGTKTVDDRIILHVPTSLGYSYIWAWATSGTTNYTGGTWGGAKMTDENSDGYYDYTIMNGTEYITESKVIFNSNNGSTIGKNQTNNLYIPAAGEYWYIGGAGGITDSDGSAVESNFTKTDPNEAAAPSYTMDSSAYIGGTFDITVKSSEALTASSVTIGGVSKTLVVGTNTFNASDFTSVAATLSVSGTLTNSAGSTIVSGSISVVEKPSFNGPAEWSELRIYQVMVSSFQDGDSGIGYTSAYGPSGALTGGDLQGIINALDYIKSIGMNAVWMTPIFQSAGEGQLDSTGYFAYDYFNIDNHFGTNEKFAELVEKAHDKGIAIILDGVFGHHGGSVATSPSGYSVSGTNPVNWTDSNTQNYYYEVAQYWIKNYKIDGWRFDQCYQVGLGNNGENCNTGGHNYWYEVRAKVKDAALTNGAKGSAWGTLGYTVGEHWDGNAANIQAGSVAKGTAAGYGLQSCFDFPARYNLINAFAKAESDAGGNSLGSAVSYSYKTASSKGYTHDEGYYPNLFVTNHDLVRFGNLLNWKHGISPSSSTDKYYGLHKCSIAVVAAYSGPITVYYGDEWGAYVDGYTGPGALGAYNDNAARSTGKISGFSSGEQSVVDFTSKVMAIRAQYPAMWKGDVTDLQTDSNYYVGKKTLSGEKSVGVIINKGDSAVSYSFTGTDLIDGGAFGGSCPAYSAKFVLLD